MGKEKDLKSAIKSLKNTGLDGFEGLIRQLLEEWTGQRFYLAKAGSQRGRDMSGTTYYGNAMVAECKHYASSTPLKTRDILGEIAETKIEIPDLDLWVLVTSRDVSDQIATALKKWGLTLGIEILIIDQPDNEIGTLQILCAEYQDVTLAFLKENAKDIDTVTLSTELEQIRRNARYITRKNRLQNILARTDFGFDSVRCKEQERFCGVVSSINQSQVDFNQDVAIQDNSRPPPIKRSDLFQQIDMWWQEETARFPLFILLGDEGSGKTWVVIQWLKRLFEETFPPLVILIPSSDVNHTFSKLHDLVSSVLSTHLRCGKDYMERRIENWFKERRPAPRILLFLDGLNETPHSKSSLLMDATSNEWDGRVAIIATSWSEYWENKLKNRIGHIANIVITEGYNDRELEQVASFHKVKMSVIPQDIIPLLRKPRLCDLALRKLKALVDSGDLTLEHLLFEDYKDRQERKLGSPISQKDFLELLATLSKKYREGNTSLSKMDVQQSFPADIIALQEALYGGMLESSNNFSTPFKVKRDWLVLGLGLLLADDVFKNNPTSLEEGLNYVDQWLDPHPDMDIKAQICSAAIFASLQREYLPIARQALLVRWIGARNPDLEIEQKIAAYVPHCLPDLIVVTEEFWKAYNNNGLAQYRISWAFQRNLHRISDNKVFINAIMRWMSLINRTGQRFDRKQDDSNGEQLAKEVAERAGKELAAGEKIQYMGYEFDIVDDEGLLRLARFALYLLSGTVFSTFSEVFIRWALSRKIMGRAYEAEEVSWVLRLSNDNLWPEMKHTLRQLVDSENIIQRQAAHIVLGCIGNKEAMQLRNEKLSDVFPLPEITIDYQRDPCISIFSWTREDCLRCLEREDVPIRKLLMDTSRFAIDPSLKVPAQVINRFEEYVNFLPVDKWHSSFGQTLGDIMIKQAEPALARWISAKFVTQLRKGIQRIGEREDEGKRQLLILLPEAGQIVGLSEREKIENILENYRTELEGSETVSREKGADRRALAETEGTLVQIMHMNADNAVDYLLKRPIQATDLLQFGNWSDKVSKSKKDMLLNMLLTEQDHKKINRILWILSYNSPHLQPEHSERLIELLKGNEKTTRSLALRLVVSSKDKTSIEYILKENNIDNYVYNDREMSWCAWIFAHYGQLSNIAELAKHLPIGSLSDVIEVRGLKGSEVEEFAALVHVLWQDISRPIASATWQLPEVIAEKIVEHDVNVTWLSAKTGNSTIRLESVNTTRGGHQRNNPINELKSLLAGISDKEYAESLQIFWETVEVLRSKKENVWWIASFNTRVLAQVAESNPNLIKEWVDKVFDETPESNTLLERCSGFYQSLCVALVSSLPDLGFQLWKRICDQRTSIRFIDEHAGTDCITALPFSAEPSSQANVARKAMLDACYSDFDLLVLSTAALAYNQDEWLMSQSQHLIDSPNLWQRAKGIALCCLLDVTDGVVDNIISVANIKTTWVDGVLPKLKEYHNNNKWAQYWYREFLKTESTDVSWCAFRLFLKCVDRRWYTWVRKIEDEFDQRLPQIDWRIRFRKTLNEKIKHSIEEGEKKLKEVFLSVNFRKGELIPFEQG